MTLNKNARLSILVGNPGRPLCLVRRCMGHVLAISYDRKTLEEEAARIRAKGRGYSFAVVIEPLADHV